MLTPIFRLDQTDHVLIVIIHAPIAKLSELEVCVEDQTFYFTASPYFLKFDLPGSVCTDEQSFETELIDGDIIVKLRKSQPAHFKDLNLITKLLVNQTDPKIGKVLIEECNPSEEIDENEPLNWFTCYEHGPSLSSDNFTPTPILIEKPTYGFCGSKSGLFEIESDLNYVIDLPEPDKTPANHRWHLRRAQEEEKFSSEHYLADFFETEVWQPMSEINLPWSRSDCSLELTSEDRHRLITFATRKLPLISCKPTDQIPIYLGLLDILLAYTYDFRVREGEPMTESGWNIAKLSATLCWFEVFHNLPDLIITFYRRALVYPLVRNWRFCSLIKRDVACLLQMENVKEWCVKCLLEVRELLINYPGYHVFAELYINDFIVWIQTRANTLRLNDLGKQLQSFKITKDMVELRLKKIEQLGKQCLHEEKLQESMKNLSLSAKS